MKIKRDFVTNSSSCSYLVFIPDGFEIDKFLHLIEESSIEELVENDWYDSEEFKCKEDVLNKVKEKINDLQQYGSIHQDDGVYYIIGEIFRKLDLVLGEPETGGGDGSGAIMNINGTHYREKLTAIIKGGWGIKHGGWGIETKI
jgi:hypothetical protein